MSGRVYGLLLRLLPRPFRVRYAVEMRRMFEEEWAESGAAGRVRLWWRALRGVAWTAVVERASPGYGSEAEPQGGGLTGLEPDVRVAVRSLARRPAFAATAVLTIGLGIGAGTAVFSVVDATILRGLPLPEADRLVSVWGTFEHQPATDFLVSQAEFADLRTDVRGFERTGAWATGEVTMEPVGDSPARTVDVAFTAGSIYDIVGARTVFGRLPGEADDRVGAPPVLLLSHALWQEQFGGDPAVVGTDAGAFGSPEGEIIGVLAPEAALPGHACGGAACASAPGAWVHWVQDPADWAEDRSGHGMNVVSVLRAGATVESVLAELSSLQRTWADRYAGRHGFGLEGHEVHVASLGDRVLGTARRVGLLLSVAAGLLLVLACANVANLLLARGETRTSEVGVRIALGASPARVARPVLVEGAVLGLAGGLAGVLVAGMGLPLLLRLAPSGMRGLEGVAVDGRAVAFAVVVALTTGVLFAVAPAWTAARRDAATLLRASGRGRTGATRGLRVLVAGQTALATLLLAGAGLLTRSLLELNAVDPGLETENRIALDVRLSPTRHPDGPAIMGFFDQALRRAGSLPGVEGAAILRTLPLRDDGRRESVLREGDVDPERRLGVTVQAASANVLDVLGIPLLEGRDIAAADRADQPAVGLLNASAARALWPGESAAGKRLRATFLPPEHGLITIVGVYGDVRSAGLSSSPAPELLLPLAQLAPRTGWVRAAKLVVHTTSTEAAILPALRAQLRDVDPLVPVENATTMRDVLRANTDRERFLSALLGAFAALALVIAAVGVDGVVSFTVARQSREFAIRNALGARRAAILAGVLRTNALVAGAGALAGLACVLIGAPALRAFLYDVAPYDALVLTAVPLALIVVALLSSLVPALRATNIAPSQVLQEGE